MALLGSASAFLPDVSTAAHKDARTWRIFFDSAISDRIVCRIVLALTKPTIPS